MVNSQETIMDAVTLFVSDEVLFHIVPVALTSFYFRRKTISETPCTDIAAWNIAVCWE
jgi:hypothetical protein